ASQRGERAEGDNAVADVFHNVAMPQARRRLYRLVGFALAAGPRNRTAVFRPFGRQPGAVERLKKADRRNVQGLGDRKPLAIDCFSDAADTFSDPFDVKEKVAVGM